MNHTYDASIAKEVGIREAVLLYNLDYWIEKNKANDVHQYDGRYWTYNSIRAYAELFPEMSVQNIRTALRHLEEKGYIETGNFNKANYDRTIWYTLTDKYYTLKCENQQMHLLELTNGIVRTNKPIPNINTNKETYINSSIDDFFKECWARYPRKRGKNQVKPAQRKKIYEVGKEMFVAIDRYREEAKGKEEQYILNGSTFFNGRYEDYLGDDYTPAKVTVKPTGNTIEPPKYQKFERDEPTIAEAMPEEMRKKWKGMFK